MSNTKCVIWKICKNGNLILSQCSESECCESVSGNTEDKLEGKNSYFCINSQIFGNLNVDSGQDFSKEGS